MTQTSHGILATSTCHLLLVPWLVKVHADALSGGQAASLIQVHYTPHFPIKSHLVISHPVCFQSGKSQLLWTIPAGAWIQDDSTSRNRAPAVIGQNFKLPQGNGCNA
jgi:hypothetical protein